MAAQQLIDEINDYLDVINVKIERLSKTSDRLQACVFIFGWVNLI